MDRINKILDFLQSNPTDSFLQHALALEYIKINEEQKAKELFINILNHNENYVGSYYHLAKLFEQIEEKENAILYYEKGMQIAKQLKDNHSYNELQAAYEDLVY
jgi:Tfp pilus assembly protein PilF